MKQENLFRNTVRRLLRLTSGWTVTRSALLWLSRHGWVPDAVWSKLPVEQTFRVEINENSGFTYRSDLSDSIGRGLFWGGLSGCEPETVKVFSELAEHADLVVDVGAHTGLYTLIACAVNKSANVIAIEAAPEIATRLQENVSINNWRDRCRVVSAAASDRSGIGKLHVPYTPYGSCSTMCSLNPTGFGGLPGYLVDIPLVTLDDVCPQGKLVHLIKIDVEGFAVEVLKGAKRVLVESRPFLILEILPADSPVEIAECLTSLGYKFFDIRPNGLVKIDSLVYGGQRLNTNVLCATPEKLPKGLAARISPICP